MGHNNIKDAAGNKITLERVQELFDFLCDGTNPEGVFVKRPPKLGARKAETIIWFLQEHMDILPDNFEMCVTCSRMYDSHSEGDHDEKTGRCHCGNCMN